MLTTVIVFAVIIVLIMLWLKAKSGARKTPEQRTAVESILVSLFVMHRKNLEEAAETIRTPEISREEGIQRCKDAVKELNDSFQHELTLILQNKANLKDRILPELRKKPGYYNGKAQEAKKKYQEYLEQAEAEGAKNPEKIRAMAEKYKAQGCKFLAFKKKSLDRIDKAEDFLQNIDFTIDETKMTYEERKTALDDMRQDLEMMIGNISGAKFTDSLNMIRAIKEETADKLRVQNARIEAESWVQGVQEESESNISASEFTDDFDKL
jgi:hypothetical protein